MEYTVNIYTAVYISKNVFNAFELSLNELENKTETHIRFDFGNQFFEIQGKEQRCVDVAENKIIEQLLPKLHSLVDNNYIQGTYESSFTFTENLEYVLPKSPKPKSVFIEPPSKNEEKKIKERQEREAVISLFEISPHIKNPQDFLIGPPQHNMMNVEYLELIGRMTETHCRLDGRTILIKGYDEEVNDAVKKFKRIQDTHVGCHSKRTTVPCLHYPVESEPYKLFFCPLFAYRHKSLIPASKGEYYVVLPVFYNKDKQEYDRPKNMIPRWFQENQLTQHNAVSSPTPQYPSFSPLPLTSLSHRPSHLSTPEPTSPTPLPYNNTLCSVNSHWGLDRDFKNVYNTNNQPYLSAQKLSEAFQPVSISESPLLLDDFPSLTTSSPSRKAQPSTKPYCPTLSKRKPAQVRVLRILPQKSVQSQSQVFSQLKMAKEYNFNNIKCTLEAGLEAARGHKGEVMLSAKLGKLLWFNVSEQVTKQLWKFHDLKEIILGELGVQPHLNPKVTVNGATMDKICQILPASSKHYGLYEFHCAVRNQRQEDYKDMVIYMKDSIIEAYKVVYSEKTVSEIDWASLDRKLDFQMNLKIREVLRTDVKPITTFVKRVSINPFTRVITFEDVKSFLRVQHILWKEVSQHKINQFVIEVTRVEKLCLKEAPMNKHQLKKQIIAEAEGRDVWFEVEIFDSLHSSHFELNKSLEYGSAVDWSVRDILGEDCQELSRLVACILTFIEKAEDKFANAAINY